MGTMTISRRNDKMCDEWQTRQKESDVDSDEPRHRLVAGELRNNRGS